MFDETNYTLLNMKFFSLFMLTKAHDPTRRSGTFSFRLILLIVNNSKEKFQSEISKNNIYFVQRKATRNQWISECNKTNDAGNSQSTRLLQYLRRSSIFPVRLFVDMPHDLPCILSCILHLVSSSKNKHGEQLAFLYQSV